MTKTDISLSLRPTQGDKRKQMLEDLERDGWVSISHTGAVTYKRDGQVETTETGLKSLKNENG